MLTRLYNCTMYRCATKADPRSSECNDRTRKNTESRELTRLPESGEQRPLSLPPSFFFPFAFLLFFYLSLHFPSKYIYNSSETERERVTSSVQNRCTIYPSWVACYIRSEPRMQTISIPTVQQAHRGGS